MTGSAALRITGMVRATGTSYCSQVALLMNQNGTLYSPSDKAWNKNNWYFSVVKLTSKVMKGKAGSCGDAFDGDKNHFRLPTDLGRYRIIGYGNNLTHSP
ncbi:hypothetical protein CEXT_616701 [Caerostris extrusa]|uniref:Uncharacterized protein n=1 Tax=Caerostris extrusa TaxID=172846 RepID=A0AAV4N6Y3_CAEEX|nr:hypothetical protein CEXT_616701 [Caerostris extrusa]